MIMVFIELEDESFAALFTAAVFADVSDEGVAVCLSYLEGLVASLTAFAGVVVERGAEAVCLCCEVFWPQ